MCNSVFCVRGNRGHRAVTRAAVSALVLVFAAAGISRAAPDIVWKGGQGNWEDAKNWSGGVVPNASNVSAVIDGDPNVSSDVTLTGPISLGALSISPGDNLSISNSLGLASPFSVLSNQGTINIAPSSRLYGSSPSPLILTGGGTINLQGTLGVQNTSFVNLNEIIQGPGTLNGVVSNAGTIILTGVNKGTSPSLIISSNTGSIHAGPGGVLVVGGITIGNSGSSNPPVITNAGATGGVFEADPGSTLVFKDRIIGGTVRVDDNAQAILVGGIRNGQLINSPTGKITFDYQYTGKLATQNGGNPGDFNGTITNPAGGTITIGKSASFTIAGFSTLQNSGQFNMNGTLSIAGAMEITGGGTISLGSSGGFSGSSQSGAPLLLIQDQTIEGSGSIALSIIKNGRFLADVPNQALTFRGIQVDHGIFEATNGGVMTFNDGLIANGSLKADGSTIKFSGNSKFTGDVTLTNKGTIAASGSFDLTGPLSISSGSTFSAFGALHLTGPLTVDSSKLFLSGGSEIATGPLTLTNSTLNAPGKVTINGPLTMTKSTLNASSDLAINGTMALTAEDKVLLSGVGNIGGALSIDGAVLQQQNVNAALAVAGPLTVTNGGTLIQLANLTVAGSMTVDNSTYMQKAGLQLKIGGPLRITNGSKATLGTPFSGASSATSLFSDASSTVSFIKTVVVTNAVSFATMDETKWTWGSFSALQMTGGVKAPVGQWDQWASLEIGGTDFGSDPSSHTGDLQGFDKNFDLTKLEIGPGAHVLLTDLIDNGNRGGLGGLAESLYVDRIVFDDANGSLNLNGLHLYYKTVTGGAMAQQIIDVAVVPEPGMAAMWMLGATLLGSRQFCFARRRGWRERLGS